MPYADATRVKKILTEKGPVEDGKVQEYIVMADNFIDTELVNIKVIPELPIPNPPQLLVNLATALACAYFYKFESGDTITADAAETHVLKFMQNAFRRPQFSISTGPLGGAPSGINYAGPNWAI